tara:strand:+ start:3938 stop:4930 length:993 start_codon:yes stop_codon:yes gene_type:complete
MIYKSYLVEQDFNRLDKKFILFYGENLGLKNDFKKKIKLSRPNAETIRLIQDDIIKDEDNFFNMIFNLSLFEKEKIFIIDNVNDKILPVLEKIEQKIVEQKIILFSELLDRKSKLRNYFEKSNTAAIIPCYVDNEITLKKIILDKLKGYTGLTNQNLNMILENCGLDRSKLNNELDKIAVFFEKKIIDNDKLEALLNLKVNDSFDLLKDQALVGNKTKTNKLMSDTILEDGKNIFYLNVINQRLMKLLKVNEIAKDSNLEDAIGKIKPPIFWKDKTIFNIQAQKWDIIKLKKILDQTYKLELLIKSNSQISQALLIKKLLINICCLANAS